MGLAGRARLLTPDISPCGSGRISAALRPCTRAALSPGHHGSGKSHANVQGQFITLDTETFPKLGLFSWQEGYGAFSVGVLQAPVTVAYVEGQAEHHRRVDSREEFNKFLKKHGIELPTNVE
jgi:hypothetical protein